jgi:hypothetical protein
MSIRSTAWDTENCALCHADRDEAIGYLSQFNASFKYKLMRKNAVFWDVNSAWLL